jgi:adenylate cyclase
MTGTPAPLEARLTGSFASRMLLELFGNSAVFPIANVLLELLAAGSYASYLAEPDLYAIAFASLAQAYALTAWQHTARRHRIAGNLVGPAIYTAVETWVEGARFFMAPHHIAYWCFSLAIGLLQAGGSRVPPRVGAALVLAENVVRSSILFFMYAIYELRADAPAAFSPGAFFADRSHVFIALAVLLLGLSAGLANLTSERYLALVRQTSAQLKLYSEWLLGRELLNQAFVDPSALALTRRERAVLFMDVRGFTRWSEAQPPEAVVDLLDRYYRAAESALARHATVKVKLSADEVMAVFGSARQAVAAALELRRDTAQLLSGFGLGAGIGIHVGPLVEGLLGSAGVKFYDVIGDSVNTAKRIESAAAAGEVLVSQACRDALGPELAVGPRREISAKGKDAPVPVYPVDALPARGRDIAPDQDTPPRPA